MKAMPESSPDPASAWYPGGAMSYFRSLSATLLAGVTTFCIVTAAGCGTGAVGVDECRDIERARCRAGASCGIVSDVPACERYYRDHCLHGLATKPPSGAVVDTCVQVIEAAGRCASEDPEARLEDCQVSQQYWTVKTACEVVAHPELTVECAFLTDTPPEDDGSGGQGGAGDGAGGESG
jgi:hypothetical protein